MVLRIKKGFVASERDEQKRQAYWLEIADLVDTSFVFLDETSAYVGISSEYGWAHSSERVTDTKPKGKKQRVSLIAACSLDKSVAEQALVVPDSVNKSAFLGYLEYSLLPTLEPDTVIILDNWTVHYGDEIRELVEAAGCKLLYLPTYSPDFNPIEHLFAKVKAFVKGLRPANLENLTKAFCDAVKTITQENVRNSFEHCGYSVQ